VRILPHTIADIHNIPIIMMEKSDSKISKNEAPEYRLLDPFIGKWNTVGSIKTDQGKPDIEIQGTDTYEWVAGGAFVLHTVNVMIGSDRKESIEVIGFDTRSNRYPMHSYGNSGEMAEMYAEFSNGRIHFLSENLRFTGSFSDDQKILSGIWEQRKEGDWKPFMDIKLSKS